jgi:uncharacterized protein
VSISSGPSKASRNPSFLRLAVTGEAGLLLPAWALARWLDLSPFQDLEPIVPSLLWGALATLPLLLGLAWMLASTSPPIRRLVALVVEQIGPLLVPLSVLQLALLAAVAGFSEEVLFRGVIQVGLERWLPPGGALLAASFLFGLVHFASRAYAVLAAVMGLYLGILYLVQGSLLAPIVTHALYDFVALLCVSARYRSSARPAGATSAGLDSAMDAITAIHTRTSVRRFRPDPIARETIQRLLDCAVRAPNHKLTEPWRFVVLTGHARDRFADIRARHRLKRFADPSTPEAQAAADKVRRDSLETPVYLVVMTAVSPDEITREEDYAATMMAIANLMTAAQSLRLGTYLRTGGVMRDPALLELAGVPESFRVVGILSLGHPAEEEAPRRRKSASELTRWVE